MKRIYLLMILMVALIGTSKAQTGLALTKVMADSVKYSNPVQTGYIIVYLFKNNSGKDWDSSYRLRLQTFYSANPITLNWKGVAGYTFKSDSTLSYRDTVGFTAAPSTNPANLCDSLWLVDKNGNTITDTFLANNKTCKLVKFIAEPASVNNLAKDGNALELYPNPAQSQLNVDFDFGVVTSAKIAIRDLTGKLVSEQDVTSKVHTGSNISLDISALSAGMYILEVKADDRKTIGKFTVSK